MSAAILLIVSRHQEGPEMLRRKGSISSAGRGVDWRAGSHDGRAADGRRQFSGSHLNGRLGDYAVWR